MLCTSPTGVWTQAPWDVKSSTRMLAVDPLGADGWGVGPQWIWLQCVPWILNCILILEVWQHLGLFVMFLWLLM